MSGDCALLWFIIILLIITEHSLPTPENFGSTFVIKIMSFTLSHQLHLIILYGFEIAQ